MKIYFKKYNKIILQFIIFFFIFCLCNFVLAANLQDAFKPGDSSTLGKVAGKTGAGYNTTSVSPEGLIGKYIEIALSYIGVVFLILMIYGGFLWMTAKGNEQQVEKAKSLITAAIIGMVIVVSAYAITYFVTKSISGGALVGSETTPAPDAAP